MSAEVILVNSNLSKKPYAIAILKNKKVLGVVPLMDPRDADHSGDVSMGEWALSKVPVMGSLTTSANMAEVLLTVGNDRRVRDPALVFKGTEDLLKAGFYACRDASIEIYINKLAGPAASISVGGVALLRGVTVGSPILKKGLEQAFKAVLRKVCRS